MDYRAILQYYTDDVLVIFAKYFNTYRKSPAVFLSSPVTGINEQTWAAIRVSWVES